MHKRLKKRTAEPTEIYLKGRRLIRKKRKQIYYPDLVLR